ncbi:cytochrome P450 [Streptosporangium becharense]|uniref:Cytochrome P450 n=1 Tax=Streptosporangium becharense TaxID=1816182 RepID=A0A7W9MJE0_9ACTN|nr:cytochrome P450 [Streptosporangium becharense]MBB2910409.1 cytochrome P450 [Streptosporangium becharense]MBB5823152.1 cytochrome P450 [Streptosporangium becharense]
MRISVPPFDDVDVAAVDFLDSGFYADGDPHALWARLRADDPVHWFDPGDGREPFWVVTRHAEVTRVLKNHEEFSSRRGTMLCIIDLSMPDIASDQMMPDTDPPRHGQLRDPLNRALTRQAVGRQEERMREVVHNLIRPGLDGEVFDLARAALMFPMAFTGQIMGMPSENWPRMSELTTMTIAYDDPDFASGPPKATLRQAHHELFAFFNREISRRDRSAPADDLIGILLSMSLEESPLTDEQIMLNCYALLLGANVTTPHAVCTAVRMLAEDPERYRRLCETPALRDTCLEEVLRWSSPASHFMRYAQRDVELAGRKIEAGQPVSVWLGSANRDERVFRDPYRFDIARRPNRHVAFGVGPHYCIGAGLARLGLRIFLSELTRLVEKVEVVGETAHLRSNFVAGYKSMPVRFTPRPGVGPATIAPGGPR